MKTNETRLIKLIISSAAALMFLAAAVAAEARTIIVHVDPSTWTIVDIYQEWDGQQFLSWANFSDIAAAHQTQYGTWVYRHYTGGFFDTVVIERSDNQEELQTLSANNLFYIDRSAHLAYACSTGYNGTGDGTSGEVVTAAAASNGDLWIGGRFLTAGGWQYSSNLSCFRWTEGWAGLNGVFASGQITTQFSWDGTYRLLINVEGPNPYVYGPLSSGGTKGYVYGAQVKGNEWHKAFPDFWFSL